MARRQVVEPEGVATERRNPDGVCRCRSWEGADQPNQRDRRHLWTRPAEGPREREAFMRAILFSLSETGAALTIHGPVCQHGLPDQASGLSPCTQENILMSSRRNQPQLRQKASAPVLFS